MAILKIEAEFEGPANKLFQAMTDLTRTFGHRSFQDLKALSPLKIQVIGQECERPVPADPFLLEDVHALELGVRTFNCLKRVGIETVGDVVQKSEGELMAIPNFGRPSLNELIEKLAEHDLQLRQT